MEERMARIEGILEQMDKRLGQVETRLNHVEAKLDSNFKWTLGILMSMWITIILAVVFK